MCKKWDSSLYHIQGDGVHFHTGWASNEMQCLMGILFPEIILVEFDRWGSFSRLTTRSIPIQFLSIINGIYQADDRILWNLMEQFQNEIGFIAGTIEVKSFFLIDRWIGIKSLPDHYQDVLDNPEDYDAESLKELQDNIRLWNERGAFVLYWAEEYYMSGNGKLESS